MRFRATIGTAALWGAVTATTPAQTPARSPTPAFPARTEAVTVDVVVLDKDGVPVAGLGPAEFTIREDGVTQSVTAFESIAAPEAAATPPGAVPVEVSRPPVSSNTRPGRRGPTFVVVFDDAHLTPLRGEAAREAIASFLALEGRPGDRVTLAPTSGGTWWTAVMPQGAADLAGALGRLKGLRLRDASARQMSDFEALRISRYRDERVRNEVFTRLIEMDQIGDPDLLETFFLVASRATGGGESHQAALDLNLPEDALARLRATWLPVQRDFDLAPGVYQARVAVRDANARRVASVVHDFEVPPAAGLAFTSPVLTDTVIAAEGAGGPPRPALVARRTFAAGARLYAQFEVTGAAGEAAGGPRVRAGHELRRVDGLVLAHLDPTPMPPGPEGRVTRLLAISLRDARPGEHELILTARDDVSGHVVETREPFLVAAPEEAAMQGALVALPGSPPPPRQTQVVRPPSGSPQSPPATRDLAGYQSLVRRYGAEARDRAVLELASWPPGRLKDVARAHEAALVEQVVLASGQGARRVRPDLEAQTAALDAALLLTEAALLRVGDEEDGLEAAKRLFEALGGSPDGRERHKKWALAVSGHFLDQSRVDGARRWAEEARRVDGSDAAVLVALGVVSEIQVTLADAHGGLRPVSSPGREAAPIGSESLPKFQSQAARERLAREAEDLYDRALEHEPDSVEARLRRGRLRARRGRAAEAAADLDWVAAHATDVRLRAVAHLLLARQADGQGRTEPALRHYESALELAPGTLSALIGRSELLARSGRAREAAESLTSALSRRTGPEVVDPWLAYHLGFHPRTADVFTALRGAGRP